MRTTTSAPSSTCKRRRSGSTAATSKRHYSARACKCALRVHSGECHLSASAGRLCRTLFERQRRRRARPPEQARAQTRSVLHAPRGSQTSRACRTRGAAERSCPCGGRRGSSCSNPPDRRQHAVTRRAWRAPHLKRALMAPTTESSLSLQRRVRGGDASAWCWKRWRARRTFRASAVRARVRDVAVPRQHTAKLQRERRARAAAWRVLARRVAGLPLRGQVRSGSWPWARRSRAVRAAAPHFVASVKALGTRRARD